MKPNLAAVERDVIVPNKILHFFTRPKECYAIRPMIISAQKRWLWILVMIAAAYPGPVYGTAISVLIFHDRIIAATDSMGVFSDGRSTVDCKIRLINGWLFLTSGNVMISSFNVLTLAHSSLLLSKTPRGAMDV